MTAIGRTSGGRLFQLLASLLLAALLLEASARVALHWRFLYSRIGGLDSPSQRLNWVRQAGARSSRLASPFFAYNPRRGWALRPGISALRVYDTETLNTNALGLRGAEDYPYERTPGRRRMVVLGDSYTFGDEVSDDATYARQLATLLPNTEVLNLGVDGYGHDQMLLYLHDEGLRYRPDIVVLGYVWFDAQRGLLDFMSYAKPRFALEHGRLRLHGVPVPDPDQELAREKYRSNALDLLEMAIDRVRWRSGTNERRARALSEALMDSMVALARSVGAVPVIAYLPVLTESVDTTSGLSQRERVLYAYCNRRKVNCVFLRPRFLAALRAGASFHTTSHWRATEHRIAAEAIRDYLIANGFARASPVSAR